MKTWVYQDDKQVKKHGKKKASWYVGWTDPEGRRRCKSCGAGAKGKSLAAKEAKKIEAQLITGTYQDKGNRTWEEFREQYENKVMNGMEAGTREATMYALDHFERLIKPVKMRGIHSLAVADYVAKRRLERGLHKGTIVSPATVNKELRHLRAALYKAASWNYLAKVPEFPFLREAEKLPTYISPEHFGLIYEACDKAKVPNDQPYPAADWWRALLMLGYMTGWRIGQMLALRREDVDLDAGFALTRAEENKGKRDQKLPLHPIIIEHLRKLLGFDPLLLPWNRDRRKLFIQFQRIQKAAGIQLTGRKDHYGFHDLRRAFATMNADKLTPDALQALMQHRDYQTTRRYINMARQLNPAVQNLFVPNVPKIERA